MATTNTAVFPQNPNIATAIVTLADDVTDAATNAVVLVTAGANGAEVSSVTAIPRATVTASSLHMFVKKSGASEIRLFDSKLMTAHTVAATTSIPVTDFDYDETNTIVLAAGDALYVGSAVALAGGIVFTGQWVDL